MTLREEHVDVQLRAVDRPLTDAEDAFRERVIDVTEHSEEVVVSKEARVKEELVIRKEAGERTETVHDTTGTTGSNPPGTAASRAVDNTLGTTISGTNISGANPKKR